MKFNTKKKIAAIVVTTIPCAFNMTGCLRCIKSNTTDTINTEIAYSDQSESAASTSFQVIEPEESTSITEKKPTGFSDYIDETVSSQKKYNNINNNDTQEFRMYLQERGSYEIGYGNPYLIADARTYLNDDTVNAEELPCFSDRDIGYEFLIGAVNDNLDYDYVRYVLEENDLRMWVDEIPYSFFEEKFPEYIDICQNKGYCDFGINFFWGQDVIGITDNLLNFDYNDTDYYEYMRMACFLKLTKYNQFRTEFMGNISRYGSGSEIEQGLSVDGKYVWVLTEHQYKTLSEDLHKVDKCQNVDMLVPETREDLIASGVDVEKYDEMCEHVFGGAKMNGNQTETDDQQRTRGTTTP